MLGLDAAGKTTILYRLHIGEVLSSVPTIGTYVSSFFGFSSLFIWWAHGRGHKFEALRNLRMLLLQASTWRKWSTRTWLALTVWDVGGQDKSRPLWRRYLSNSDALVISIENSYLFWYAFPLVIN
jgi:ADP-ribosylation factor 1/2